MKSHITQLDSFCAETRRTALRSLTESTSFPPTGSNLNLHMHSFFSYNAQGFSPSRLAYEARCAGFWAAGLCDFDLLDGRDEFLNAALILGLRSVVSVESRVFVPEYATQELNSPGEPGVAYMMGMGFATPQDHAPAHTPAQPDTVLDNMRHTAQERSAALIERINAKLPQIAISMEKDVFPLTPTHNPTERHIITAYLRQAALLFQPDELTQFWAELLNNSADQIAQLSLPQMEEQLRTRLVKRGGIGYQQPTPQSFPPLTTFINWIKTQGALPTYAWLDGTTTGEAEPNRLLDDFCDMGCVALNIIPERNWNLADPQEAERKQALLHQIIASARARNMVIAIGTELNRQGQPFVDNLATPALSPYYSDFRSGAAILVGHTRLQQYAEAGYTSPTTDARFGSNQKERNHFFAAVGELPPLSQVDAAKLASLKPEQVIEEFERRVREA